MHNTILLQQGFDRLHPFFTDQRLLIILPELLRNLGWENLQVCPAIQFLTRSAECLFRSVIDIYIPALPILDPCQTGEMLHEPGETFFTLS